MLPDERAALDELIAESIDSSPLTSDQIDYFLAAIDREAGGGVPWVAEYERTIKRVGATHILANFRRSRPPVAGTTAKGTQIEIPAFAAVRVPDDEGKLQFAQLAVTNLTAEQVRSILAAARVGRDTLSRKITLYRDGLAYMQEHGIATFGEALRLMVQEVKAS